MFSSKNRDLVVGNGEPQKDSKKATSSAFVYPGQPTPLQQTLSNLRKPAFSTEEIRSVCSKSRKQNRRTHGLPVLQMKPTPSPSSPVGRPYSFLGLFSSCWLVPRTKQCSTLFFNSHSLISSLANYRIISARQKGPHLFFQSRCMQGFDPETSTCSQLWAFLGATRA